MFQDKIKINTVDFFHTNENKDIDLVTSDQSLLKDYTLGIKEFKDAGWQNRLQMLKDFIQTSGKMPSSESTDSKVKQLGLWNLQQKANYKHKRYSMKNEDTRKEWERFVQENSILYRSNEKKWDDYLLKLEQYIITHNKTPAASDKNAEIKRLGKWTAEQKRNYTNFEEIMKHPSVRSKWLAFTQKYPIVVKTLDDNWNENLKEVEEFINENGRLPSLTDTIENGKRLAKWLYHQNENYKDKKQSLESEDKRKVWESFIQQYPSRRFMTQEQWWLVSFHKLVAYVRKHNQLPSGNKYASLSSWTKRQIKNYEQVLESMKNEAILDHWNKFMREYPDLLPSAQPISI
jgi:hypothetical protein